MEAQLVHGIVLACFFLIGLCAIEHYFSFSRLPYVCWILLFGVLYGFLHHTAFPTLPPFTFRPAVILYVFLPLLIFDSSRKLKISHLKQVAFPSIILAAPGVVFSALVMAVPLRVFTGIGWWDILLFTGIMSATDPVAISAVFEKFPIPEKLRNLIEGESLLNDGTVVVIFLLLSRHVLEGKELLFDSGLALFALSIAGAVLLGIILGAFGSWVMLQWQALKDHFIGPLMPLIIVYLVFCLAQYVLDVSGVIAVMAATFTLHLFYQRHRLKYPAEDSCELKFSGGFWEFLGQLANAVLFFMLGVEIGAHYHDISWIVMPGVILALLLSRSAVVYLFGPVLKIPLSWRHTLNLAGLKGALPIALILMIPENYAYRQMFLSAALAMCLFTLVANTLGMRVYLKRTPLGG